jgi:hypothetical protein
MNQSELSRSMASIYKETKGIGRIIFHFTVDPRTGKAILVNIRSSIESTYKKYNLPLEDKDLEE